VLLRPRPLAAVAAVLCLAGCGPPKARIVGHYSLKPTASCLRKAGLRVAVNPNPPAIDFVTSSAPAGALASARDRKVFTIAFGNTQDDANILVKGYRRSATSKLEKRRLRSLLDLEGNAVVYWHTEPTASDADAVRGCLA
jgi:hypothetical protein